MSTVIIGAGVAGLAAARKLTGKRLKAVVLEGSDAPGGLARTDQINGFAFDRTGHFLHFKRPEFHTVVKALSLPLESITRRAAVVVNGIIVPYPLQYNLWALGRRELVLQALEAARAAQVVPPVSPATLADVFLRAWGEVMLNLFFRPYNEKLWGRILEDLPADCVGPFVPSLDLTLVEQGGREPVQFVGYNGQFLYPTSGRFGDLVDTLATPVQRYTHYGCRVVGIDLQRQCVHTSDGQEWPYQNLVSTMPLPSLLEFATLPPAPSTLLDYTSICNIRVGLRGRMLTDLHWIYVPDHSVDFHRIGFPVNVNPRTCPPDHISLSIEYTIPRGTGRKSDAEIAQLAIEYLTDLALIDVVECVTLDEVIISPAYVVWRSTDRPWFASLSRQLKEQHVYTAGRFGSWDYLSVEGAFMSGLEAASYVASPKLPEAIIV